MIEELDRPNTLRVVFTGAQVGGSSVVELVPLTPHRTRLSLSVGAEAKTMAMRLLFQSLKLGRSRITTRFTKALAGFAEDVERKHRGN